MKPQAAALDALTLAALLAASAPAIAQATLSCPAGEVNGATAVVVPGPEYAAGGFHRWLWGNDYRALWTTPMRVPVLDPAHYAGGLKPEGEGGGLQTSSLSLVAADGREYKFRSVDKDPKRLLPQPLRGTVVGSVVQDQTAGAVPAGSVVVGPLLDRLGILNAPVHLYVMAKEPSLGEFDQKFGGRLGMLEPVPGKGPPLPGFEEVDEVKDSGKLFERLDRHPEERVDSREFLKARLVDMIVGDWDRHVLQWRWGRSRRSGLWRPIPHDRDQAFTRYQGVALAAVRPLAPRFTVYGPRFETIKGLMWDSRDLDRRLLTPLDWTDWQAAVTEIREKLDDATIRDAVCRLPREHLPIVGRQLVAALQGRRDHLADAARQFYLLLSAQADIFATFGDDVARIERRADGSVRLQVAPAGQDDRPWIDRVFRPGETREFRLYLLGGDDRVRSVGRGPMDIRVRVIGGDGNDVLDDSRGGGVRFYDTNGENGVRKGPGTRVDERQWLPPVTDPDDRPLDWGDDVGLVPWVGYYRDVGAFLGAGVQYTTYGFRQYPYAARHTLRGGYATAAGKWRLQYTGDFRRRGALEPRGEIEALASGIEVLHFYGFGNQPVLTHPDSYYWVDQQQYVLAPSLVRPIPGGTVTLGGDLRFARTDLQQGRNISALHPYGVGSFGQVGLRGAVVYDVRDRSQGEAARKGLLLTASASYYPAVWSVRSGFGQGRATASTYVPLALGASLAVRAGGQQVWGVYPFHDAAFLGSWDTVRGLPQNRYAGDASLFGNAELRFPLPRQVSVFSSNRIGLFALADVGRVFYRGESSRLWHHAFGGGSWMSFANGTRTFSAAIAHSEGNTGFYLYGGMLF